MRWCEFEQSVHSYTDINWAITFFKLYTPWKKGGEEGESCKSRYLSGEGSCKPRVSKGVGGMYIHVSGRGYQLSGLSSVVRRSHTLAYGRP